jgi:hypothetical protein
MASKQSCERLAESFGCSLDATNTGAAGGWLISLDAPEGNLFKHSGCSVDCDIAGNGDTSPDWAKAEQSIRAAMRGGFECDES